LARKICRNPKCGTSHQTCSTVCPDCGEPYRKPVQPTLSEKQKQILGSIREAVRVQTDHAVNNGLTRQQVLDVIKEVLR
jgi:hypothetical protein